MFAVLVTGIALSVALLPLGAGLVVWVAPVLVAVIGAAGAYVSMPLWYWAVADPGQVAGLTNVGLFTVDTFGEALHVCAGGLALVPVALLLTRVGATAHARLALRLLAP